MTTSAQKRIVLLCQHFYPEMISTGMHMTELALGLTRQGWKITVFCAKPSLTLSQPEKSNPVSQFAYEGIQVIQLSTWGVQMKSLFERALFAVTFLLSSAWMSLRYIRHYDALMVTTNPPFIGLVGVLVQWLAHKPYLMLVYDVYPDIAIKTGDLSARSPIAWLWERLTRVILRRSNEIVVIGRDMRKVIEKKLDTSSMSRITMVPNWSDEAHVQPVAVETNSFIREYGLENKLVVQYAGRMGRTHNLEPLVEAAVLLRTQPVIFQFVGDGAKRQSLQTLVARYQLNNVQFVPYQPMERLAEMLSAASLAVVCLESIYTGLSVPSKTYGVMASAKPILAFLDSESEIGLTILEANCGFVMKDPSGAQVADAIRALLSNQQLRQELGQNARREFLKKYTLSKAVEQYDNLLKCMCDSA